MEDTMAQDAVPDAALADATPETTPATTETVQGATEALGRAYTFVVTVQPQHGLGYRAILSLGTEGCDPVIRSVAVQGWPDLFAIMQTLLAEAEAQWRSDPRYPSVVGKVKAAPTPPTPTAPTAEVEAEGAVHSDVAPPPAEKAPAGQLALFG
jgi:hypothetical protein